MQFHSKLFNTTNYGFLLEGEKGKIDLYGGNDASILRLDKTFVTIYSDPLNSWVTEFHPAINTSVPVTCRLNYSSSSESYYLSL